MTPLSRTTKWWTAATPPATGNVRKEWTSTQGEHNPNETDEEFNARHASELAAQLELFPRA